MQPVLFFKALADPTRLNLIMQLKHHDSLCVCDLTTQLEQPQPTISRHLSHLKKAGLVHCERRGNWMWYGINQDMPNWCLDVINSIESDIPIAVEKSCS